MLSEIVAASTIDGRKMYSVRNEAIEWRYGSCGKRQWGVSHIQLLGRPIPHHFPLDTNQIQL